MTYDPFASAAALIKQRNEHREEFRREIERHAEPYTQVARDTDKAGIELGHSILKTSTLLNGGALAAIPAVVTLFGIDAKAVMPSLLTAGASFTLGLIFCWLSGVEGFFALAHRAERDFASGEAAKLSLYESYYPPDNETEKADRLSRAGTHKASIAKHDRNSRRYRSFSIVFSFASIVTFVVGNIVGGWSVLHAPTKPANATVLTTAPPCKNGAASCEPWERDWGKTELKPGSTVTNQGAVIQPPLTKP